jgi:epoxide hydrolase 4
MVPANGLAFEVFEAGEGDRLALLLHGFPQHAVSWHNQVPFLAERG